jgi:3-methyladenine DNA glycosylase AlkD
MEDLLALAEGGDAEGALRLADHLADDPDPGVQAALARALYAIGRRDPTALSVFLAANAHRMPQGTIRAAGKALPESE